jgi:hypothetical protein
MPPDNVEITAGAGTPIRTDLVGTNHYQYVKLDAGGDGVAIPIIGGVQTTANSLPVAIASDQGALPGLGGACVSIVLAVTNGAYTIGDVVGGLLTFAAATRVAAGKSIVQSVKLAGVAAIPYELWFFNADIATPAADNAPFTLVVADMPKILGIVPIGAADYYAAASAFNAASVVSGIQVKAAATTIYAYLKATAVTSPGTTQLDLTVAFKYVD